MTTTTARRLTLLSLVLSAGLLAACAGTPTRDSTGQLIDDSVITARIKAAVLNEPTLKSSEITVETFKGRVQLSGFVNSREDIDRAVVLARATHGVSSVANDMRLK